MKCRFPLFLIPMGSISRKLSSGRRKLRWMLRPRGRFGRMIRLVTSRLLGVTRCRIRRGLSRAGCWRSPSFMIGGVLVPRGRPLGIRIWCLFRLVARIIPVVIMIVVRLRLYGSLWNRRVPLPLPRLLVGIVIRGRTVVKLLCRVLFLVLCRRGPCGVRGSTIL